MKFKWNVFLSNVDTLVKEKFNGNQSDFNEAIGMRDAVSKWRKVETRSAPSTPTLLKMQDAFCVSMDWLLFGIEASDFEEEYCLIPKYDAVVKPDEQGSYTEINQDIVSNFAFRKDWLTQFGPFDNLALYPVVGDAMMPLLKNGNVVMVDRAQNDIDRIVDNKIYAFREGAHIRIKRLAWENGQIKVTADNVKESYYVDRNIFVLKGRVIWFGRDIE